LRVRSECTRRKGRVDGVKPTVLLRPSFNVRDCVEGIHWANDSAGTPAFRTRGFSLSLQTERAKRLRATTTNA